MTGQLALTYTVIELEIPENLGVEAIYPDSYWE